MNHNGEWAFPTTGGGKKTGFNESGIQFFNDNILLSLAREICQNSLDAKLDNNTDPVTVEFKSFKLKKKDIIGYDKLLDIINKEIDYAQKYYKNDKNSINFYTEARRLLEKDELLCLRISDFNTTGLTGSDSEIDSKWDRLVKSEGFSEVQGLLLRPLPYFKREIRACGPADPDLRYDLSDPCAYLAL